MPIIKVKVQPCAKRNEMAGRWLDMVKVKVTAPPEDGRANKACIELLSTKLGILKSRIELVRGHTSREKQFNIEGLTEEEINSRL